MKHIIITFLGTLMLSACMNANTTSIQRGYVTMRDTCRTTAEGQFAYAQATGGAAAQKDASGTLAQLFSDCMEGNGWAVASTKGRPSNTAPLDSIYDLPQTPGGQGPAASVSTAKEVPQAVQPVQQQIPQQVQQQGYTQQGYNVQQQYAQPQTQAYQQPAMSAQQQQALQQQYYQQQQAYQNYMQQQQAYEQQYQQYYQQQQVAPQQQYQQQQYQQPQYTQPQAQPQYYQQQPVQPQSYYQPEQVEPIQHSATSLHLSRGGAGGARAK